ncbi:MAG: hypothetical protein GX572_03350, partial [Clostridia bacterium]|nr:hypothetical protein [Clostridia bacterium]
MKKIFIYLALLLLACLPLAACGQQQPAAEAGGDITATSEREVYEQEQDGQVYGTITLGRLHLIGREDNAAIAAINADLDRMLDDYLGATADQDAMYYAEDLSQQFTHERIYSLAYVGEDLVSVVADGYDFNSTAAHPTTYRLGYVYSLSGGTRLKLADLLPAGYEQQLADFVIGQIKGSGEEANYFPGYQDLVKAALAN